MLIQSRLPSPDKSPSSELAFDGVFGSITPEVLREQLREISVMDRHALLQTLTPHRELPGYDPAGYIIGFHKGANFSKVENDSTTASSYDVNTGYDLGVVFGRLLLTKSQPDDYLSPVISKWGEEQKSLVEDYLMRSKSTSVKKLTSNDSIANPDLVNAIHAFIDRCKAIVPDLTFEGTEELERGIHDYLSVMSILDVGERNPAEQISMQRRMLGRLSMRNIWRRISRR